MKRFAPSIGPIALAMFVAAAVVCGAMLDGYSHREQPLAWLGAAGVPGALAFNTCAFILPGLSVAIALWMMRSAMPATMDLRTRVGMQLTVLSALAFAAQGLLPLNADDLTGPANALHALAWTLWWIAFAAGGVLLAFGGLSLRMRLLSAVSAMVVLALALPPWPGAMAAFAPRLAYAAWFVWAAAAPRLVTRAG
jgi:hypothetical membrane protein